MASQALKNLLTGVKEQFIPTIFRSNTNINPHYRISTPRLRHFKKNVPRRLRLPRNLYNDKETKAQQEVVASYHRRLDPKYRAKIERQARAIEAQLMAEKVEEHKANKPIIVED